MTITGVPNPPGTYGMNAPMKNLTIDLWPHALKQRSSIHILFGVDGEGRMLIQYPIPARPSRQGALVTLVHLIDAAIDLRLGVCFRENLLTIRGNAIR